MLLKKLTQMNMQDLKGNSGEDPSKKTQNNTGGQKAKAPGAEEKPAGRPEKPDDQKSTKTIQNKESMS